MEWVTGGGLFIGIWAVLINNKSITESTDGVRHFVLFLPFYALLGFAVISVSIIAWRVYTFNDCKEAAEDLQREIKEARADLTRKGMKFE